MKKTIYLFGMLMLAGAMVFTSCNKDDDDDPQDLTPNLSFMGGAQYTSQDATMIMGEQFMVGINASENANSNKNIESFKVVRTFNNVPTTVVDSTDLNTTDFLWESTENANAAVGTERWTFTITDKNGQMKELSFTITTESATTPLGAAEALVWKRVGGADGTGLDMFGLKWEENGAKANYAYIQKGMADKFVVLTPAEWTSMETIEDLAAAVEAGTDMGVDPFKEISADLASSTFDYALATKYNGEYFLIHLTDATVVVETAGTTITINGMYKK